MQIKKLKNNYVAQQGSIYGYGSTALKAVKGALAEAYKDHREYIKELFSNPHNSAIDNFPVGYRED